LAYTLENNELRTYIFLIQKILNLFLSYYYVLKFNLIFQNN